jgi:D-alanyl-D-alanine carboxypeptidase/glycopeptide antibiotics resistance protein
LDRIILSKGQFLFGGCFMNYLREAGAYIPSGFAASIIFLALHEIGLAIRKERVSWLHRVASLAFGLYLTMIFAVTVSPVYGFSVSRIGGNINLVPFEVWGSRNGHGMNFWGNILFFIPVGTLLVFLSYSCRKLYRSLLAGASISFLIEVLQLFSNRSTDIDDIILNTAGVLCGYLLGRTILMIAPQLNKKIGVMVKVDRKYVRRPKDGRSIALLAGFILISVFTTGFSIKEATIEKPFISTAKPPKLQRTASHKPASVMVSADINARNAYLWNISANTVLYEKKSGERIAPASTTKLLTALTVLDYCKEEEQVLVGEEVKRIAADASRAWLYPGNRLTVRQLLDALLLPSGNDAAYTLAVFSGRKICGDDNASIEEALEAFVKEMNKKAEEAGASDSNFVSPDGYDDKGQYTTAYDLACIARTFLESDLLRQIAGQYRISDRWVNGREVTYYNTNELINPQSPYYYRFAEGLKTGKSEEAGACLISCADIDGELYICVVMGSTETGRWEDSLAMYQGVE